MNLLDLAKQIAVSAEAEAQARGLAVSVCVIDEHGNMVLKQRMDGATLISIEMSERKAYTSAALGIRTCEMTPLSVPGQPLFTLTSVSGGRYVAFGGGVPICVGKKCLGGLGISGGTTEQDTAIAEAVLKSAGLAASATAGSVIS